MKLITMERIKGEINEDGERDWFVAFESGIEEAIYKSAIEYYGDMYREGRRDGIIEGLLTYGLSPIRRMTDDDIYYYFMPGDKVPEIGEQWTLDDTTWRRVR